MCIKASDFKLIKAYNKKKILFLFRVSVDSESLRFAKGVNSKTKKINVLETLLFRNFVACYYNQLYSVFFHLLQSLDNTLQLQYTNENSNRNSGYEPRPGSL